MTPTTYDKHRQTKKRREKRGRGGGEGGGGQKYDNSGCRTSQSLVRGEVGWHWETQFVTKLNESVKTGLRGNVGYPTVSVTKQISHFCWRAE